MDPLRERVRSVLQYIYFPLAGLLHEVLLLRHLPGGHATPWEPEPPVRCPPS